jgi:predicted amidohydrolase
MICHDSSFPEVAATLAWKGARIIFSPHYNGIPRPRMDEHRIFVRNNHIGIAAHNNVIVARSNVVGYHEGHDSYGYGDSAIFGPDGSVLAEAGLFTEKLVTLDVGPYLKGVDWRARTELRPAIIDELHKSAMKVLRKAGKA